MKDRKKRGQKLTSGEGRGRGAKPFHTVPIVGILVIVRFNGCIVESIYCTHIHLKPYRNFKCLVPTTKMHSQRGCFSFTLTDEHEGFALLSRSVYRWRWPDGRFSAIREDYLSYVKMAMHPIGIDFLHW